MSTSADQSDHRFPRSNADSVALNLAAKAVDLDGSGLVEVFRILMARAEELKSILGHSERSSQAMLAGDIAPAQELVDAELLEALYTTRCLKWFLACACKRLAEDLEFEVHQKQRQLPRVKTATYSNQGEVEKFDLQTR